MIFKFGEAHINFVYGCILRPYVCQGLSTIQGLK